MNKPKTVLLSLITAAGLLAQQEKPPAGGGADQGGAKVAGASNTQNAPEALLTSTDSVQAASYECASNDQECPVTPELGKEIAGRFNQDLKTGENKDTELVIALKKILTGQVHGRVVVPKDVQWLIIHLINRQDRARAAAPTTPMIERWLLAKRTGPADFSFSASKRIMGSRQIAVVF